MRARLVERAEEWRWSGVAEHLTGRDDDLVSVERLLERCAGRFADPVVETEPSAEALSAAHGPPRRSGAPPFLNRLAALIRSRSASQTARPKAESYGIE